MELEQLLKLIQTVSDSKLTEFKYETEAVCIKMGKEKEVKVIAADGAVQAAPAKATTMTAQTTQETEEAAPEGNLVKSPLVGTFYAASAEGAEPYVKVGDKVKKGQVLAIVEAMKLMNEIESEFDGTVEEVLVENAQSVEYGQPLFRIK
nr:acetyl-CoA carboxylase biotin carboxyl carrier protein [uncultured Sellimonas sp.]